MPRQPLPVLRILTRIIADLLSLSPFHIVSFSTAPHTNLSFTETVTPLSGPASLENPLRLAQTGFSPGLDTEGPHRVRTFPCPVARTPRYSIPGRGSLDQVGGGESEVDEEDSLAYELGREFGAERHELLTSLQRESQEELTSILGSEPF